MISLILIFFYAAFKGVKDNIEFHYSNSFLFGKSKFVGPYSLTWTNKYKNGKKEDGEKFLGSTTFFVWLTDSQHLLDFIRMIIVFLACYFAKNLNWTFFIFAYGSYVTGFTIAYNFLNKRFWKAFKFL